MTPPSIDPSAYIAPSAVVHGDVTIAAMAVIMFGAVLRTELSSIAVGARSNIQDNAVVHADEGIPCHIGGDVTVGHGAVVHSADVGDHCLIGIGACALNASKIGEGAWLGAGSVLPEGREIPPWTLALGVPARPVRDLTEDEVARQRDGIANYLRYAEIYRRLSDHPNR